MDVKYIFILSLLLYPAIGLVLGYLTRNTPILRRCIMIPIFVIGTIAIIASFFGLSTIHTEIDFVLYASVYLSLSLGMWYVFFKKSRILAAILMLIIYLSGYAFSLALPLVGDIAPKTAIRLGDDIVYKERALDAEFAGKQVEIFKVYHNFFEKRIAIRVYKNDAPAFVNDMLEVRYSHEQRKVYLSIPDDKEKYIYTFHEKFDVNWTDSIDVTQSYIIP